MTTRTPFIGGNWKMNTNRHDAAELANAVVDACDAMAADVAVFPPFPYLDIVRDAVEGTTVMLGAQNLWPQPNGAFTGEVSPEMLCDLEVQWVLAGHSERRQESVGICEKNVLINRKVKAALHAGLGVILCVGESLEQREADKAESVVVGQLEAGLAGVEDLDRVVIAYEPVWAIGTGRTATPEDAQQMHERIRQAVADGYDGDSAGAIRIQYGGSVKPGNAAALFQMPDIDGGLIGGASLNAADFAAIVEAAASLVS